MCLLLDKFSFHSLKTSLSATHNFYILFFHFTNFLPTLHTHTQIDNEEGGRPSRARGRKTQKRKKLTGDSLENEAHGGREGS